MEFAIVRLTVLVLVIIGGVGCSHHALRANAAEKATEPVPNADIATLTDMISAREQAMIEKDLDTVMSQFSDDATWINSQGYYFEGKQKVFEFHSMLARDNPLDYRYEAGKARIRLLDSFNAIAYYSWKMLWYERAKPETITNEEIGLMTLTARKRGGRWQWVAVTNQHTPWFYEVIEPASTEED
jgi:uncharacterized protein (TIGR02246 family)